MKDYKAVQYLNLKTKTFDDQLSTLEIKVLKQTHEELTKAIFNYFSKEDSGPLIFPAKSYAVAIIYSQLIEKYFKTPFLESLNDKDLFLGTDKYFVPYESNSQVYKESIKLLKDNQLFDFESSQISNVRKTIDYFYQEFDIK